MNNLYKILICPIKECKSVISTSSVYLEFEQTLLTK